MTTTGTRRLLDENKYHQNFLSLLALLPKNQTKPASFTHNHNHSVKVMRWWFGVVGFLSLEREMITDGKRERWIFARKYLCIFIQELSSSHHVINLFIPIFFSLQVDLTWLDLTSFFPFLIGKQSVSQQLSECVWVFFTYSAVSLIEAL